MCAQPMNNTEKKCLIDSAQEGLRLDALVALLLPESSLRARRRLCEKGLVCLDGKEARPGTKVRAGQELCVRNFCEEAFIDIAIVYEDDDFVVVKKPVSLHTSHLAGSSSPSLESLLYKRIWKNEKDLKPILLTRLDEYTSGFVVLAFSKEAEAKWRKAESLGQIEKHYLALVEGFFSTEQTVRSALDTEKRKKSRVLPYDNPDILRHTHVKCLENFPVGSCPHLPEMFPRKTSLVLCQIFLGARHQIRAHLASIGYPLVFDSLYDAEILPKKDEHYHLHNISLSSPFFSVQEEIFLNEK